MTHPPTRADPSSKVPHFKRTQDQASSTQDDKDGTTTQSDDEDDYMSMTFNDPLPKSNSQTTSLERARQRRLAAELRSRPKSKSELEAEAVAKRDAAMRSSLFVSEPENRGAKMLARMGYVPGQALGKKAAVTTAGNHGSASATRDADLTPGRDATEGSDVDGQRNSTPSAEPAMDPHMRLTEPLRINIRERRTGLGAETKAETVAPLADDNLVATGNKRQKVSVAEFRSAVSTQRTTARLESQITAAMKVAQQLSGVDPASITTFSRAKGVNVLFRELGARALEKEVARRRRRALDDFAAPDIGTGRHCRPGSSFVDTAEMGPEADLEDADDILAMGTNTAVIESEVVDEDDDQDDELDAFRALSAEERLAKLVMFLRDEFAYCFWCMVRYTDQDELAESCPGLDEDSHG